MCEDPTDSFQKKWHPFVFEAIQSLRPDVVLADFMSCAGTVSANELGIPVIINVPGPVAFLEEYGFEVPNMRKASNCCGLICFKRTAGQGCI